MSWASSSQDEAVSFLDMSESGVSLNINQSHLYTNECITKLELKTRYKVRLENLVSYGDSELIMKRDVVKLTDPVVSYPYLIARQMDGSKAECYKNPGEYISVYSPDKYPDGKFRIGMTLFDDSELKYKLLGGGSDWYTMGTEIIVVSRDGVVTNIYECNQQFEYTSDYYLSPCTGEGIWKNISDGKYYNGPSLDSGYASGDYFTYADQTGIDHDLTGLYAWNRYYFDGRGSEPSFIGYMSSPCSLN